MAGSVSPAAEGPTYAPPSLPAGWIAQWDGSSKKYYFVQLSTGVSQWDVPTQPVQTGNTPGQQVDHPYGTPGHGDGPQPEIITHPDGSQTMRHSDGTMEPIMPDGTRGGPNGTGTGDRGLGVSYCPFIRCPFHLFLRHPRHFLTGGDAPSWWACGGGAM
jgi:hypothetical protein